GNVGGMDLLAAAGAVAGLAAKDLADEVIPLAGRGGMGEAVDARGAEGADGPALAQAEAVDELLQGRLVGAVVARRTQRVGLVQRPVVKDHLVDRAGRDED